VFSVQKMTMWAMHINLAILECAHMSKQHDIHDKYIQFYLLIEMKK
jgi:hypothetical protein